MVVTSPVLVCCIEPNDTLLWCREVEVRLVAEAGLSFAVVDNAAFRSFAQLLIQIGSKHGNCRVLSLSDRRYSLNPLSQTRID